MQARGGTGPIGSTTPQAAREGEGSTELLRRRANAVDWEAVAAAVDQGKAEAPWQDAVDPAIGHARPLTRQYERRRKKVALYASQSGTEDVHDEALAKEAARRFLEDVSPATACRQRWELLSSEPGAARAGAEEGGGAEPEPEPECPRMELSGPKYGVFQRLSEPAVAVGQTVEYQGVACTVKFINANGSVDLSRVDGKALSGPKNGVSLLPGAHAVEGEIPCGVNTCEKFADKSFGGRSLSIDNAVDVWGDSGYTQRKGRVHVCKSCYAHREDTVVANKAAVGDVVLNFGQEALAGDGLRPEPEPERSCEHARQRILAAEVPGQSPVGGAAMPEPEGAAPQPRTAKELLLGWEGKDEPQTPDHGCPPLGLATQPRPTTLAPDEAGYDASRGDEEHALCTVQEFAGVSKDVALAMLEAADGDVDTAVRLALAQAASLESQDAALGRQKSADMLSNW